MRKELYAAIRTAMAKIEEVKHIDLWNHNVEFIEEEAGWERPAVFVEFGPIAWQPYVGGGYRGDGSVRLHIVTDWMEGGQEAAWDLIVKIREAMERVYGYGIHGLYLTETLTNHNHEDILESIEGYAVKGVL
ncbi:hypothetical protein [Segatella baroniae]|uniref:hypothetical protein n=1 Tax=Segatella baroniae TaxID=305719 RepID=UPI0004729120|nr:hypothetical protein [Segatella baroniae]